MPLDPNIALGVRPIELPNPLAQYAQFSAIQNAQNNNALSQYTLAKAKREDAIENSMADIYRQPGIIDPQTGAINRNALISAAQQGPAAGRIPALLKSLDSMDIERVKALKESLELGGGAYAEIAKNPTRQNAEAVVGRLAQLGVPGSDRMLASLPADPEAIRQWAMVHGGSTKQTLDVLQAYQPKIEYEQTGPFKVPVNKNAMAGPIGPQAGAASLPMSMTPGEVATDARTRQSNAETARHNKATEANAAQGQSNQVTTNEGKVRDDYNQASKTFVAVRDAHQRVLASAQEPSAAGDLALIFNYMKVLDPGSTVREGEFATAQNSGGVDDRTRALWNKVINGERLSDNIRKDFVDRSDRLYKAAEGNQMEIENNYESIAKRGGMNPQNVVIKNRVKEGKKAGGVLTPNPDGSYNYGFGSGT